MRFELDLLKLGRPFVGRDINDDLWDRAKAGWSAGEEGVVWEPETEPFRLKDPNRPSDTDSLDWLLLDLT